MGAIIALVYIIGLLLTILFINLDIKLYNKYYHRFLMENWCCNTGSGFRMWYKVKWGNNASINKNH